jgi:ABC-type cobalt transport system substrate-binding protein
VSESNFRDELREVWVPKNAGELEGLLLTIQNEPGKKILKHKIQQTIEVYRDPNQKENYAEQHKKFNRYSRWFKVKGL